MTAGVDRAQPRRRPARCLAAQLWIALAAASGALAGCGVEPDDAPRDIATEQGEAAVDTAAEQATVAGGAGRIFLVVGGSSTGQPTRIQSVSRDIDDDLDAAAAALLAGPTADEADQGLRSAIPPRLEITGTRRVGNVVVVDVGAELGELSGSTLVLALAQLVYTFDNLEGVDGVSLTVGGDLRPWPDGTGDLSTRPLTVYDYPGLERTSQPAYPAVPGA